MFDSEDQKIVRCFCCGNWVRLFATQVTQTGTRGDEELWCTGCLYEVDAFTKSLDSYESKSITLELEEGE